MSPNFPHMLSEQAKHIAHIVERLPGRAALRQSKPTAAAEAEWIETIVAHGDGRIKFLEACTPGYYNNEGKVFGARRAEPAVRRRGRWRSSSCCANGATATTSPGWNSTARMRAGKKEAGMTAGERT